MPQTRRSPVEQTTLLVIAQPLGGAMGPAQIEFNKLLKKLEAARDRHRRKQARLDAFLVTSQRDFMPLIELLHRAIRDLIFNVVGSLEAQKFSDKRRRWLRELMHGKVSDLLGDGCGLSIADRARLEEILVELEPPGTRKKGNQELEFLRQVMAQAASEAGIKVDFSDLDPTMPSADFERIIRERFQAAAEREVPPPPKSTHKQTKSQQQRDLKQRERNEAKKRDFKSLYKQLAKILHPDLEIDPLLKLNKEIWMKRLTSAYAAKDSRELLMIEMEWLGKQATHLALAGEQKLLVYCSLLKEQISGLKQQTDHLLDEPQYRAILRFADSTRDFVHDPTEIHSELREELSRFRKMIKTLESGGPNSRRMLEQWADEHGHSSRRY